MASLDAWRIAFARQAIADLQARDALLRSRNMPQCQQLHFLQMACEKICKSYLCGHGADPASLQSSHAYIARVLPVIIRHQLADTSGKREKASWVVAAVRKLSRQIELLAPAVDAAGGHPSNCEYPWETGDGDVVVPADHHFEIDLLRERAGRLLLKELWVVGAKLTAN